MKLKNSSPPITLASPRLLRETKNFRIIVREVATTIETPSNNILSKREELVLEVRDKNAMQEPYWKTEHVEIIDNGHCYMYKNYEAIKLWKLLREMFL